MSDTDNDQYDSDTERPRGPKGEILDQIEREGPITQNEIVESAGIWAPDSVYIWLRELESDGYLESQRGDIDEHGTTRRVWYVEQGSEQQ